MINITGPSALILSPNTLATVLDALANHGPWRVVDAAIKEITAQLKKEPMNEHSSGRSEPTSLANGGDHSDSPVSDSGMGSSDAGEQVARPN